MVSMIGPDFLHLIGGHQKTSKRSGVIGASQQSDTPIMNICGKRWKLGLPALTIPERGGHQSLESPSRTRKAFLPISVDKSHMC